jgi:hypothetical protein
MKDYLLSAQNAFSFAPPKLGYGQFGPVGQEVMWQRMIGTGVALGGVAFGVICRPFSGSTANSGAYGTASQNYLTACVLSSNTAYLSTASGPNLLQEASQNQSVLAATALTFRPVTSSTRVTVRYPMTTAPGRLFAFNTFVSDFDIAQKSPTQLAELDCSMPVRFNGSGLASIQCNWRQKDPTDFISQTLAVPYINSAVATATVIVGLGWASSVTFDVDSITHIEYTSGVLNSGDSADQSESLAMSVPIEKLGALVSKVPVILTDTQIAACGMPLYHAAISRHARSGRSIKNRIPSAMRIEEVVENTSAAVGGAFEYIRNLGPAVLNNLRDRHIAGQLAIMAG